MTTYYAIHRKGHSGAVPEFWKNRDPISGPMLFVSEIDAEITRRVLPLADSWEVVPVRLEIEGEQGTTITAHFGPEPTSDLGRNEPPPKSSSPGWMPTNPVASSGRSTPNSRR